MPLDQTTGSVAEFVEARRAMMRSLMVVLEITDIPASDRAETVRETISALRQLAAISGVSVDA